MRVTVNPGGSISGSARVPGDKSIAHRLLILAATAQGASSIAGLPRGLDVTATARVLSAVAPSARSGLERWLGEVEAEDETHGLEAVSTSHELRVEGEGRRGLRESDGPLDCANSGTTLRLTSGVLSGSPFRSVLTGDGSLRARPMERVARPLRAMGASVGTTGGTAPVTIDGASLHGIEWSVEVPSAQVKSAILLAALVAEGETIVREPAPTRDHTERLLRALGAPIETARGEIRIEAFQHDAFDASVPGDVSSAAFLIAAAMVTGGAVDVDDVGLNPTRTRVLDVVTRAGGDCVADEDGEWLGEPFGRIGCGATGSTIAGVRVSAGELPLVIDEVPALAAIAAHAEGASRFSGAAELRVKESDRLTALAQGLRELGGDSHVAGDDLVVAGGGLRGGSTSARGDHRLAMAFTVAALAADTPCTIEGAESAAVSFPEFFGLLSRLGASLEVTR